jgi:histone-lysine N-methyltransferase SETMAR
VLLHANVRPHVAGKTRELLERFKWEIMDRPAYSPDLAPSDFHLFKDLKNVLRGKRFERNEKVKIHRE